MSPEEFVEKIQSLPSKEYDRLMLQAMLHLRPPFHTITYGQTIYLSNRHSYSPYYTIDPLFHTLDNSLYDWGIYSSDQKIGVKPNLLARLSRKSWEGLPLHDPIRVAISKELVIDDAMISEYGIEEVDELEMALKCADAYLAEYDPAKTQNYAGLLDHLMILTRSEDVPLYDALASLGFVLEAHKAASGFFWIPKALLGDPGYKAWNSLPDIRGLTEYFKTQDLASYMGV